MKKIKYKRAAKLLLYTVIVTSIGFLGLIYKYKGEKSPGQIIDSAYYKIIGLSFGLPSVHWDSATPDAEGLSNNKIEELSKNLEQYNTHALLIIRGGNIVFEHYRNNQGRTQKYPTAAMAKAVTAAPVLLTTLSEGRINLDDPLWKYYPKLKNDPVRSQILIKHLIYHTSGIEDVDFYAGKQGILSGWKAEYYDHPGKRFLYSMTVAPVKFTPGTREEYAGIGYYALAYAATRSIQDLKADNIYDYLRENIMRPLEIPDTSWNISYGKSHSIDDMSIYAFGSGAMYTARASARIGELMLNKGVWKGKNLIDPELIDQTLAINTNTQDIVSENHGWTLNINHRWPSLPADAFAGLGGGHQITLVIPSMDLIVVRYGKSFHGDDNIYQGDIYTTALDKKFFKPLMDCIIGPSSRMTQ